MPTLRILQIGHIAQTRSLHFPNNMEFLSHDILIIGGGLAGLRAAIEAKRIGRDVAILSKVHPLRSHSVAAQGGINAALGNAPASVKDTWENHAFDTIKGSDYLADQDAVELMCRRESRGLSKWSAGEPFSRGPRTEESLRGLLEERASQGCLCSRPNRS